MRRTAKACLKVGRSYNNMRNVYNKIAKNEAEKSIQKQNTSLRKQLTKFARKSLKPSVIWYTIKSNIFVQKT